MSLHNVGPGARAPAQFNVIIEIPMNADPIKYEVDEATGALFVDRFMSTSMHYPCNYGYIPQTLADDGDPVDVLVITPVPLISGVVVTCRPIGLMEMQDEAGGGAANGEAKQERAEEHGRADEVASQQRERNARAHHRQEHERQHQARGHYACRRFAVHVHAQASLAPGGDELRVRHLPCRLRCRTRQACTT